MSSDAVNVASLVEAVRGFYRRGWTPATSSNFSVRSAEHEHRFLVTRSGIDKELIQTSDLLLVDMDGKPVLEGAPKPSAETLIHSVLYKWNGKIGAIYHTHSPSGAALSLR
ncbi:MAG: class II aldolase/adducin family protein, partial [Spirochaetia bacterium]|nr:class II aldolase/adducin family protein [Spirochaetia bacterium]